MTDTEKAALERRIDELCQENERLRGTIGEINQLAVMSANITRETQDRLRAENAKLRELVRAMYYCNLPWKDCDKCAMNGADMHVEIDEMEFCDGMNDRLRGLGVVE